MNTTNVIFLKLLQEENARRDTHTLALQPPCVFFDFEPRFEAVDIFATRKYQHRGGHQSRSDDIAATTRHPSIENLSTLKYGMISTEVDIKFR